MSLQEMFDVAGKSAIVSGGASGLGRAYAEVLAENGARVCMLDLDRQKLDETLSVIDNDAVEFDLLPGQSPFIRPCGRI